MYCRFKSDCQKAKVAAYRTAGHPNDPTDKMYRYLPDMAENPPQDHCIGMAGVWEWIKEDALCACNVTLCCVSVTFISPGPS